MGVSSKALFAIAALLCINACQAEEVFSFNDEGVYFTVEMFGGCFNLADEWVKKVVSMDINTGCVAIYKDADCKGAVKLLEGGGHDLDKYGFDHAVTSMEVCTHAQQTQPKQKGSDPKADYKPQQIWDLALAEHNRFRKMHSSPDLKGNPDIHKDAQSWVDELIAKNEFKSTTMNKYGNNIGSSFRKNKLDALRECIIRWYSKVAFYDWGKPGYVGKDGVIVGSFVALVWKASAEMGVGIGFNPKSNQWIVNVFYSPPSQAKGFEDMVGPKK